MNSEAFTSHNVHQFITQLEEIINQNKFKRGITFENSLFFQSFIDHVKESIKLVNYNLILPSGLDAVSKEIEAGINNLQLHLESNKLIYLNNSITSLNNALIKLSNFPLYLPKTEFDLSRSIVSFQNSLGKSYDTLKETGESLKLKLESTNQQLVNSQKKIQELDSQYTELQNQFQNFLSNQNREIEALKISITSLAEADRKQMFEIFEAERKLYKTQLDDDSKELNTILENIATSSDEKSKAILSNLLEKEKEASKIVNIVGNIGVTGNYQNIANQHKESANFFRGVALIFMVVMSGLLIYSILELSGEQFDPYKSLLRILAAAVLTYPAVYASRESTRHRNLETQNRNLELELAAIGPFIELLPEQKKQQIKEDLVKKYFGRDSNIEKDKSENSDEVSVSALEKLLKTILPYLKK